MVAVRLSEAIDGVTRVLDLANRESDEHPKFEAARREAQRTCDAGRVEDASRVLMEALEREERIEQDRRERHRCLRLGF